MPAERQLAFTGVADLLTTRALRPAIAELPAPQRRALAVALLEEQPAGDPPDVRAIAAGLLGVVRRFAGPAPVLVAIDDVQWLDVPSRSVLEFAIGRAVDLQVRLLVTERAAAAAGAAARPLPLAGRRGRLTPDA